MKPHPQTIKSIIRFNSNKENYLKELMGNKRNTIRKINYSDARFTLRQEPTHIIITCRELNGVSFKRKLTDITNFDGYRIYSW